MGAAYDPPEEPLRGRGAGGALPFLPPLRLRLRARPRVHRLRRHPRAHAGAPPARPRRQLGLRRGYGAFQVLKSTAVTLSDEQNEARMAHDGYSAFSQDSSAKLQRAVKGASFRIVVFEQIPGTLLIKGSLLNKTLSDTFVSLFSQLEDTLKMEFLSKAR